MSDAPNWLLVNNGGALLLIRKTKETACYVSGVLVLDGNGQQPRDRRVVRYRKSRVVMERATFADWNAAVERSPYYAEHPIQRHEATP